MKQKDIILEALLFSLIAFHLAISPYTKVEESFNIQAIHDIYNYGVYPHEEVERNFDHFNFPGVVPRSFVGALVIAGISKIFSWLPGVEIGRSDAASSQMKVLVLSRAILGALNGLSLISIKRSIDKVSYRDKIAKKNGLTGMWFILLLTSQFHILYYASRTLPNFIALPLVNYSVSLMLEGNIAALGLLAFTGIVFRLEVGVFAVIVAFVSSIFHGPRMVVQSLVALTMGTIFGLVTTLSIDSYFWGSTIVPELVSFYYNVVEGRSANWGTEPWPAYFKKYLLQIFRPPTVLTLLFPGSLNDPMDEEQLKLKRSSGFTMWRFCEAKSLRILSSSSIIYIAIMSFQAHKEWRFIIYVVPILTLLAANGLSIISRKADTSRKLRMLTIVYFTLNLLGTGISIMMGVLSSYNYPGGEAIQFVNDYTIENRLQQNTTVHMDVAACMTGINRFCELHNSSLSYDKTENEANVHNLLKSVDLLISETNLSEDQSSERIPSDWELLKVVYTFQGISLKPIIGAIQTRIKLIYQMQGRRLIDEICNDTNISLKNIFQSMISRRKFLYVYKKVVD